MSADGEFWGKFRAISVNMLPFRLYGKWCNLVNKYQRYYLSYNIAAEPAFINLAGFAKLST
ncbi:MAG: hypothetical protein CL692_02055 [Cellvibrionales bacterium]|nr:hypothetical protein [Cellvibrionales bacterium]HCH20306.1 hypothetical protein [Cellvibrionales bacterium]|tara:strand:- start:868 stop:1050 length:183 start_codon:yes stop_codon:yes gene_type:complete